MKIDGVIKLTRLTMNNELLIEALEYGWKIQKLGQYQFLSCDGFDCEGCRFTTSNSGHSDHCRLLANGDSVSEENLEFLQENYPEYLLKV